MKNSIFAVSFVGVSIIASGLVFAAESDKNVKLGVKAEIAAQEIPDAQIGGKDKGSATEEVKHVAAKEVKIDEKQALQLAKKKEAEQKKANEELSKKEWEIYLVPLADRKSKAQSDVLTFSDGKLTSKDKREKGFTPSNCTVTVQEDGTIVWETMQADTTGNVIFWRGELRDKIMQGMLSTQPKDGKNQDFAFTSVAPSLVEEKIEAQKIEEKTTESLKEEVKKEEPKKADTKKKKEKNKK
jgi:hypothetical protein